MLRKVIKITLTLNGQDESFTAQGDNRISSYGLAVSTAITYGNGAMTPTAQITVYGLPIETMNKLFRVQWNTMKAILNTVKIEAGEQGKTLDTVYEGNITFATINMDGAPNVALVITSQMAVVEKLKATLPLTVPKETTVDAADLIKFLAEDMEYKFENYGATHPITDTSLNGSNLEKIEKLCTMCDFDLYVEQKLIVICKRGGNRELKIPVITPTTGLIGYPSPDQRGITFNCAYDPLVRFGGIVRIKDSIIGVANEDWRTYGIVTTLEANIPQGKWEMNVNATWRDSKDAAVQR